MSSVLVSAAGYTGVTLGAVSAFSQFQRVRHDGVDGVSLATWTLFVFTGVFWTAYGALGSHSLQVILGSVLLWPLQLYIVARLEPHRHLDVMVKSVLFMLLVAVLPTIVWGWQGGVYGIGAAMTLMRMPQLVELIKARHADGVSATAWYASALCSAFWLVYYDGNHLWAAFWSNASTGLASLTVAILATVRHVQGRRR